MLCAVKFFWNGNMTANVSLSNTKDLIVQNDYSALIN